jgi:glycosyltransferase involved in cell wall biosynthesis
MMLTPFINVLMTGYSREKYIATAIESILASTNSNFELVIVDDSSTDETIKLLNNMPIKMNGYKFI